MQILGEEFSKVGRWYIALPPLLLVSMLIVLFVLATASQNRLIAANSGVHRSEARERSLGALATLITQVESAQRAYLLAPDASHLAAYERVQAKGAPLLQELRAAFTEPAERAAVVYRLADRYQRALKDSDPNLPAKPARVDDDQAGTDQLLASIAQLTELESADLAAATLRWQSDLRLSGWIITGGLILNIGLVLMTTLLVFGDMRRRARHARGLRDQKKDLSEQVDQRNRELTALSTHLQGISEQEKSALSRELHDELGGLLVAARMDLSWLQQRLPTTDPTIDQRFKRIHDYLSAGVDLKRRVVEELRPTLLDNMGLFTALRWQFKESCRRHGLICTETIPDLELDFSADASIAVFRVAQEALTNILKHAEARSADLSIVCDADSLVLRVSDDGIGIQPKRLETITSHGLGSMKHRVSALGGTWVVESASRAGTIITARIPMQSMLGTPR